MVFHLQMPEPVPEPRYVPVEEPPETRPPPVEDPPPSEDVPETPIPDRLHQPAAGA